MRAFIATLILASVCFAQWGPGGIPTDWRDYGIEVMEADTFNVLEKMIGDTAFVSIDSLQSDHITGTDAVFSGPVSADSVEADHFTGVNAVLSGPLSADSIEADHGLFGVNLSSPKFTSPLATSYMSMVGDTLFFTSETDGDVYWTLVDSLGTAYEIYADMSEGWLQFPTSAFGNLITPLNAGMVAIFDRSVTSAAVAGTQQGIVVRMDAVDVASMGAISNGTGTVVTPFFRPFGGIFPRIIEVAADYTATIGDNTITVTDTLNITLPALSAAYNSADDSGLELFIKLEADAPCTVSCAGADSLDGDVEVVLARWDCLYLQAGPNRWIVK